jgi:DNA-binding MarR family transcriptional regulator
MDQRSIVVYLAKKGLSVRAIHRDLEETFGPEAVAYSTVTMYLRTLSFRGKTEEEEIGDHDQPLDEIDEAILKALADEPFPSVRELARHMCLSRTMVHRHLTCSFGLTVRHLHWVPHWLSPGQKAKGSPSRESCFQCLIRKKPETGITLLRWMNHGSISARIMS